SSFQSASSMTRHSSTSIAASMYVWRSSKIIPGMPHSLKDSLANHSDSRPPTRGLPPAASSNGRSAGSQRLAKPGGLAVIVAGPRHQRIVADFHRAHPDDSVGAQRPTGHHGACAARARQHAKRRGGDDRDATHLPRRCRAHISERERPQQNVNVLHLPFDDSVVECHLLAPPADVDQVTRSGVQAELLADLAQAPLDPLPRAVVPSDTDVPQARPGLLVRGAALENDPRNRGSGCNHPAVKGPMPIAVAVDVASDLGLPQSPPISIAEVE